MIKDFMYVFVGFVSEGARRISGLSLEKFETRIVKREATVRSFRDLYAMLRVSILSYRCWGTRFVFCLFLKICFY